MLELTLKNPDLQIHKVKTLELNLRKGSPSVPSSCGTDYVKKTQYSDWLYYLEYSFLDYEYAKRYMEERYIPLPSACSVIREGDTIYRNLDFIYDNSRSVVVNTPKFTGIVSGVSKVTKELLEKNSDDFYKVLPFQW